MEPSVTRRFLDVNIPMYAGGKEHHYREPCRWVMTEVAEGRLAVAIDTEIVQEILYRFSSLQCWQTGVAMARDVMALVADVHPVEAVDARLAIELFERYGPRGAAARDVLHVAVMKNRGLTEIITTDPHFDLFEGITRLDPADLLDKANKADSQSPPRQSVEPPPEAT